MANKPDKFGLKFWLAVDVENKYLFNGFPYVGKDDTRSLDVSVPTDVVLKLISPVFQQGYNVTCDNFFTSLHSFIFFTKTTTFQNVYLSNDFV